MTVGRELNRVSNVFYSPISYGALTCVPVWDSRQGAKNWCAKITSSNKTDISLFDSINIKNQINRFWLEKGREGFYYFTYYKDSGTKKNIQVGDALEFASKFEVEGLKPEKTYWWGTASSLSGTEIRILHADSPIAAMDLGVKLLESLEFADLAPTPVADQIRLIEERQNELVQEWNSLEVQKNNLKAGV